MEVFMSVLTPQIPQHISTLVAELERWIAAATRRGVNDEDAEEASVQEAAINVQLQALGWDAVLNAETGRWVPIPNGYTIVNNPPNPYYYPQRCYKLPECPDQWRPLWNGEQEVRFPSWKEAYAWVFTYQAQEYAQLPLKRFRVRPPGTWGGNDYVATAAEQALQMHLNYWLSLGWITAQKSVELHLHMYEHCGDRTFYCSACQHAPCKYVPSEKWPMPPTPGWIASS